MENKLTQNDYRILIHLVDRQFPIGLETYDGAGQVSLIPETTPIQLDNIWVEEGNIAVWRNFFGHDGRNLVKSLSDFEIHLSKFKIGEKFANLTEICRQVNTVHQDEGYQQAFSSLGAGAFVDSEYRIINPIHHISRYHGPELSVVGYFAVRPILSNGDVATPEVINKYIGER